ncbi:MAG TPA: fumarylacetoacetate hydrolase family protein [Actinophytocola sp.]|uniref:2-keto-4-pentenoate hydratase n=1 Tax=Actinophytocola sp. TaxID=1872138 RepID=UPI002F9316BC
MDPRERAKRLYEARRNRVPVQPLTDADPSLGADEGYLIQQELVKLLLADGDRIVGHKVGLTSKPMQRMIGMDSPDFAPVFESTVYSDGAEISASAFIQPKIEAEIVFVMGSRLRGPGVTAEDARAAVAGVGASVEIVDSRIVDWKIRLADTIADLASSGAVARSSRLVSLSEVDTRLVGMVMSRDGELVDTGAGAAALGDPVNVVAWLANTLGERGVALEPGHLIMTGALHAAVPMSPGETYLAEFDRLGSITVHVVA